MSDNNNKNTDKIISKGKKNKDALEFKLVNRDIDDPNYDNPDAPAKIMVEMVKDGIDERIKQKHDVLMNMIPDMNMGIVSEEGLNVREYYKGKEEEEEGDEIIIDTKVRI